MGIQGVEPLYSSVVTRLVAETKATMNKVRHQWSVIFGPRRPTARPHSRLVVSTRCRVYFFCRRTSKRVVPCSSRQIDQLLWGHERCRPEISLWVVRLRPRWPERCQAGGWRTTEAAAKHKTSTAPVLWALASVRPPLSPELEARSAASIISTFFVFAASSCHSVI